MNSGRIFTAFALAVVGALLSYQFRQIHLLEAELTGLRRKAVSASPPVAVAAQSVSTEMSRSKEDLAELLRLRGEVTKLRNQLPDGGGSDVVRRRRELAVDQQAQSEKIRTTVHDIGKHLGRSAQQYFLTNGLLPKTFDDIFTEIRKDPRIGFSEKSVFAVGSGESFEFFPHERTLSNPEPGMILFREQWPRRLPGETVWVRAYVLTDGSVQTAACPTGDFSFYEREHTATAANAPKPPQPAP